MSAEQRRRALIGAVVVLAAIGVWQYFGTPAPADPVAAATRRAAPTVAPPPPADVQLEALGAPAAAPEDATRNPFAFGARPAPSAPARGPSTPTTAPPPPVFVPTGPPPPPPIPLKFIGLVEGSGASRIAVLSDSRGLVVHGREGAIIDGRFRILAIGADTLDIAYADGRGRQTLRLTGQ
jgi:hypothetical protein